MPHETLTVESDGGRYVGRCDCGWTTAPSVTGAAVGDEWDAHRSRLGGNGDGHGARSDAG